MVHFQAPKPVFAPGRIAGSVVDRRIGCRVLRVDGAPISAETEVIQAPSHVEQGEDGGSRGRGCHLATSKQDMGRDWSQAEGPGWGRGRQSQGHVACGIWAELVGRNRVPTLTQAPASSSMYSVRWEKPCRGEWHVFASACQERCIDGWLTARKCFRQVLLCSRDGGVHRRVPLHP